MNYEKLVIALARRGFTNERAHELARWCCVAPSGTKYPALTTEAACRKAYVEEEHPRDERGRWTFKDGSGSSSGSGSESLAKRKAREELEDDIAAAIAECYSNDLEKYEKAKTPEEREHYREKINEEIRKLLEYGEDYEWEDSEFADVARETKKRLAEEKRKKRGREKKPSGKSASRQQLLDKLSGIENELDSLEERYADRNGGSTKSFQFPDEEAQEEYDELARQRDELEAQLKELDNPRTKKKPAPGTKIERKDGRLAYRKETREEQVDRLLKEREEAEHFAQRYANNEELRKRYERAVREYDRQLDELGVE